MSGQTILFTRARRESVAQACREAMMALNRWTFYVARFDWQAVFVR